MDCRPSLLLPLFFTLAGVLGCSGGAAASRSVDEVFAAIQEHEATIAHRAADAEDCEDPAACPAMSEVCAAADAVCDLAREVEDADAHARCALAHRQCRAEAPEAEDADGADTEPDGGTDEAEVDDEDGPESDAAGTSAPATESAPVMTSEEEATS